MAWVLPPRFLSTLSLRRATQHQREHADRQQHFYPRSPCGERQSVSKGGQGGVAISIHALLAESDTFNFNLTPFRTNFYPRSPCGERHNITDINTALPKFLSTLSLRRATRGTEYGTNNTVISIHALLAESDGLLRCAGANRAEYFYPRSPCGERPVVDKIKSAKI